jgi:hypothetical protein
MEFIDEVYALYGQYNNNIKLIKDESTLMLFTNILKNPSNQVRPTNIKLLQIGKFYIIRYNYNGNKLWCPILTVTPLKNNNEEGFLERQLKIINNKNILYVVNFDYLPIKYKAIFIDAILKNNSDRCSKNKDKIANGGTVKDEFNFKVDWVYTFLKSNGNYNYAITAFDITKIDKIFEISSTILNRFMFLDTYYINNKLMYETLNNITNDQLRNEFSNKIKIYEEILKLYETDLEKFYKSLRNFEKSLKLIDNIS